MTDALEGLAHRFVKARTELLKQMSVEVVEKVVLNDGLTIEFLLIGPGFGQLCVYHQGSGDGKEAKEEVDPGD